MCNCSPFQYKIGKNNSNWTYKNRKHPEWVSRRSLHLQIFNYLGVELFPWLIEENTSYLNNKVVKNYGSQSETGVKLTKPNWIITCDTCSKHISLQSWPRTSSRPASEHSHFRPKTRKLSPCQSRHPFLSKTAAGRNTFVDSFILENALKTNWNRKRGYISKQIAKKVLSWFHRRVALYNIISEVPPDQTESDTPTEPTV